MQIELNDVEFILSAPHVLKSILFRAVTSSGETHQESYNHNRSELAVAFAQVVSVTHFVWTCEFSVTFSNGKITLQCEKANGLVGTQHKPAKLPLLSP